jgi:parallel beta-helix repeat protein
MVSSSSASVLLGNTQQLAAAVTGTSNTAVTWTVNGMPGGNVEVGTISSAGLYTAPRDLPNPASVTIKATSQADSSKSGSMALTITSDMGVTVATNPAGMLSANPAGMVQLLVTVTSAGHPDTHVNWTVNGVPNGNSAVGTISRIGDAAWYTAPLTAPSPASVTITAVCTADSSRTGHLVEAVQPCQLNGTIGYVTPAPYVPPSGSTCDVSDVATLQSCVAAVRSGATTKVRFTAMVNCSGNNTCFVDLEHVQGPITFFGAPGTTAGFLRTDTYTYSILNLISSSKINVANLTFDEGPADPVCEADLVNGSPVTCYPTIDLNGSSSIQFEQVRVLHSKQNGIAVSGPSQGITIQDSVVQDAEEFGIWTGGDQSSISSNVSITNNLIQDAKSNGIFLSFTQNTTVSRNTLQHNQYVALFQTCGGGCAGGQIAMDHNSSVQIYSNEITHGQIDLNNANGGQTQGIEIGPQNANVLITNNEITNNLGGGIGAILGSAANSLITGNNIYNNSGHGNIFGLDGTGIQEAGDCFTPNVGSRTFTLTGSCIVPEPTTPGCIVSANPAACPVGQTAIAPATVRDLCNISPFSSTTLDKARSCVAMGPNGVFHPGGHCLVQ